MRGDDRRGTMLLGNAPAVAGSVHVKDSEPTRAAGEGAGSPGGTPGLGVLLVELVLLFQKFLFEHGVFHRLRLLVQQRVIEFTARQHLGVQLAH